MDSTDSIILQRKQFFIESIAKFCDKCGTPYTVDDLNIVQSTGAGTIIHFSCKNCKAKHVASLVMPLGMSQRMPVNMDLDSSEFEKFMSKKVLTKQNILDVYEELKDVKSITL